MNLVKIGQTININNAKVISAEMDYDLYHKYRRSNMKVMLEDLEFGKIWFSTSADFAYGLSDNDFLSCIAKVSGIKKDIIFVKSPSNHTIIKVNTDYQAKENSL